MKNNSFSTNAQTKVSIDTFQSIKIERPELVKGGVGGQNHQGGSMEIIDVIDY